MRTRVYPAAACAVGALLLFAQPAHAQAEIKVNDDVNFKLGVLGQFQADTIDTDGTDTHDSNLFVRRLRLLFGGQVAKNVTFFVETDAPNLGKTIAGSKNITPSVIVQDAYAEFKVADAFMLDAGLMFVPFSRNGLQSAATLLPIDYGAFTFSNSTPEQSATGRDTGFQARGYGVGSRLEYRVGVFQGARDAGSDNGFRYTGRAQYNFLDTESGFFYTGTYLGKKRILAAGVAFDKQTHYNGIDADMFIDYPLGPGAVTGQFDYNRFDGGTTLVALPKQNNVLVEAGYFVQALKLTPVMQFVRRNIVNTSTGDESLTSIGANYWWAGQNANIKAAYTRLSPSGLPRQNEFTLQLQLFYF
jgi:hypothetical protein